MGWMAPLLTWLTCWGGTCERVLFVFVCCVRHIGRCFFSRVVVSLSISKKTHSQTFHGVPWRRHDGIPMECHGLSLAASEDLSTGPFPLSKFWGET